MGATALVSPELDATGLSLLYGCCGIICHGSSDGRAIANALRVSETLKDRHLNSQIVEQLAEFKVELN